MSEREIDVELLGGPSDWRGRTLRMPVDLSQPEELGAYLISSDPPPRGEDEDPSPRAIYEPERGGDPLRWIFQGWFPSSPNDPPLDWYE